MSKISGHRPLSPMTAQDREVLKFIVNVYHLEKVTEKTPVKEIAMSRVRPCAPQSQLRV